MTNKDSLRIAVVEDGLKKHCRAVLDVIDDAATYADELTDAQDGGTNLAWGRTLFNTADTGSVTLTVTVGSPNAVVSCLTGANLFANFRVGRDVQLTSFTNGGNNKTTEILEQTNDSITVINTSMVNETDNTARAQENTTSEEGDIVTDIVSVRDRFSQLKDALDNTAVATADRRADLQDWIW